MGIEAISDSDDDWALRGIGRGVGAPVELPYTPISPILPQPNSSSISSAKAEPLTTSPRPQLAAPPPRKNFMIGLIDAHRETERLIGQHTELFERQTQTDLAEAERLSQEKERLLQEAAQETAHGETWGVLGTVSQYILSSTTIVIGAACIATGAGTVPGALLIASGGLGLMDRVVKDAYGWENVAAWFTQSEELQIKIAERIETGIFLVSLGLGLAGAVGAYSSGALKAAELGRHAIVKKVGTAIGIAGGAAAASAQLGGSIVQRRLAHMHAKKRELEAAETANHQTLSDSASDAEKMIELGQETGSELSKAISAIQISFD